MEILCPQTEGRYTAAEAREDTMTPETPASPCPARSPAWLPTRLDLNWPGGFPEGTWDRLSPESGGTVQPDAGVLVPLESKPPVNGYTALWCSGSKLPENRDTALWSPWRAV